MFSPFVPITTMRNIKNPLLVLASVLITACEQENIALSGDSSSSRSTTINITAQPPTNEDVIPLPLSSFSTETFPQGPTDSDTLIHVASIPTPCSLWQGHVVVLVEPVLSPADSAQTTEARIILLSKSEWADLPSALNATNPNAALGIPATYSEGTLKDWRIPTATEAKILKATYTPSQSSGPLLGGGASEPLNALLSSIAAPTIQATDEKGPPIRYLCEDATRSFSFAPGTTISAAGTKATTYRLRLVKTLSLRQQQ